MKTFKKYFYLYIKTVLSETSILATGMIGFILASIIPTFSTFNSLIIGLIIFGVAFFIAHIRAIIKLLMEKDTLKSHIAELKKSDSNFDIEFKTIIKSFDEEEKYIKDEIVWAEKELKDISNINNPQYSGGVNMTYLSQSLKGFQVSDKAIKSYLKELKEYELFIKELKNCTILNIEAIVTNIGNIYGENVLLKIKPANGIFKLSNEISLDKLDNLPERPRSSIEELMTSRTKALLPMPFTPKSINEMDIKSDKELDILIPKLHINDNVVIKDNDIFLVLKENLPSIKLKIEVVTKSTKNSLIIEKDLLLKNTN